MTIIMTLLIVVLLWFVLAVNFSAIFIARTMLEIIKANTVGGILFRAFCFPGILIGLTLGHILSIELWSDNGGK